MIASTGVKVMENGRIKRGPRDKKPKLNTNFQFTGTQSNFNSSMQSSAQSSARKNPDTVISSPMNGTIIPTDRQYLTITADYDTCMITSAMSRGGSRAASQGKINIEKKDFDIKNLILPKIPLTSLSRMNKSISSQIFKSDKTKFALKANQNIKIEENQSKIDEFNTNIIINPSWGQAVKIKEFSAQKINKMPRRRQSVQTFLSLKNKEVLGTKKKKEAYLNKLKLQKNNQMPSMSYRTIF